MIKVVIVYKKNKISSKKYHYKHTIIFYYIKLAKNALSLYFKGVEPFLVLQKKDRLLNNNKWSFLKKNFLKNSHFLEFVLKKLIYLCH